MPARAGPAGNILPICATGTGLAQLPAHDVRKDFVTPQGEPAMGFDQKETPVICISPGINGKWYVSEMGVEMPLASFDDKEDAYAYATELTFPASYAGRRQAHRPASAGHAGHKRRRLMDCEA